MAVHEAKYQQVVEWVKQNIADGTFSAGDRLMSEMEAFWRQPPDCQACYGRTCQCRRTHQGEGERNLYRKFRSRNQPGTCVSPARKDNDDSCDKHIL